MSVVEFQICGRVTSDFFDVCSCLVKSEGEKIQLDHQRLCRCKQFGRDVIQERLSWQQLRPA